MQKNVCALFVATTAAAALLAGCTGSHTHQTSDAWDADPAGHWKNCTECGKALEKGAHALGDSDFCAECGAQIVDWGDSKSVYQFNESGDPLRLADYDGSGKLITETVYEYEYAADGTLLRSSEIVDGVLTMESAYTLVDGVPATSECTAYLEDGSKSFSGYDEYGNPVKTIFYNADGSVELQTESEYALNADGEWYEVICTTTEADGSKYVMEFSEMGDQTGSTRYDAEGNFLWRESWVYTYDENDNWETMQYYYNDVLTKETVYATVTDEDGSMTYPETVTEYGESGAKTVTVYDENDQILRQTQYDAAGKVIS